MGSKLSISQTATLLGVSLQTLRRWDVKDGKLRSLRSSAAGHRYYTEDDIENFLSGDYKYLLAIGKRWAAAAQGFVMLPRLYCEDRSIFKARLSKLEFLLMQDARQHEKYSLITSVIGEIGNNSFDHNLGNWPDIRGIFFGYNLREGKVILADRGQGVLKTLQRVRSELSDDRQALMVAFMEVLSGRAPENRGNGLKYVKKVIERNAMKLFFQSGTAAVEIRPSNKHLKAREARDRMRGCFAVIEY